MRFAPGQATWRKSSNPIGGAAALIAVTFFRRNFEAELVGYRGLGIFDVPAEHPGSVIEWFSLFQTNRIVGYLLFDVVDIIISALFRVVGYILLAR